MMLPQNPIVKNKLPVISFLAAVIKQAGNLWLLSHALGIVVLVLLSNGVFSQIPDTLFSSSKLKKLSLEELMNIEVTSISMRPEKLTEVASAVQVITGEDIHRSGATRLPEALRLASNLQMGQANSNFGRLLPGDLMVYLQRAAYMLTSFS